MHSNTIIIVCGPTAVGKTAFAIKLAQALQTEIISADSRQCYIELNIGVAKPSAEELAAVPHYFINSNSIQQEANAVVFEKYAIESCQKIFKQSSTAVMVGGTGLYIKAFCHGLDDIPEIDPVIRQQVIKDYKNNGIEYLHEELKQKDPAFWVLAEQQNPQRLMRGLEVFLSTGKSVTAFRKGNKLERPFNIIKVGLELPRVELYNRINSRTDKMIEEGLLSEVQDLLTYRELSALQTVGYRELFDYYDQKSSLNEAIEKIKTNTRHYAKRQLTWFKKDHEVNWYNVNELDVEKVITLKNMASEG